MNLEWNNLITRLVAATGIFALIGFADATYLTAHYINGTVPTCSVVSGCDVVTTSSYATLGPIPIALMGAVYYFTVLFAVMLFIQTKKSIFIKISSVLPLLGMIPTVYFVYLQLGVLDAICVYCMMSALITTGLAIVGAFTLVELQIGSSSNKENFSMRHSH